MARRDRKRGAPIPEERGATVRAALAARLREGPATARDLSAHVGIPERDVPAHLEHLERSLQARGERLAVQPAECAACGYAFKGRRRLTRPGRCPECAGERLEPPVFRIEPA